MSVKIAAFRWVPPFAQGYVRDHRVRWALTEAAIPYEILLVDRATLDSKPYRAWQPFGQVPAYRDDEVELFESGAIVMHIARKSEILAPRDDSGFARISAWAFAALNSVEPEVRNFVNLEVFHSSESWVAGYRPVAATRVRDKLAALEAWLDGKEFLESRFSAADILMSTVLRELKESRMPGEYPGVEAYLERCQARPAFQRVIEEQLAGYRLNAPVP